VHYHLLIGALDWGFLCSEVAKIREVHGRVFRSYLKPISYLLEHVVPLGLHAVHYVSIAPRVAREKDGSLLCTERLENKTRVRVDRLRGSPTSHLRSHLATSDNGRSSG
jgi:hypothetical protein